MPHTPKKTDDELMLNFQNGDETAFEEIVTRYKTLLANFVFRYLGNYEDSLDVVQEAFIRVYRNKNNYKNITKFSTWIYTIAANLAKTELRQRRRYSIIRLNFLKSDDSDGDFEIPDTAYLPDVETDRILKSDIIQKAMNKLSPKYKQIIILRDIMELSYDEISVITRLRKGTVKSRINRGRLILQKLLKNLHGER